jgi:hypothetical protein
LDRRFKTSSLSQPKRGASALQQVFRSFAEQLRLLRHRYHFASRAAQWLEAAPPDSFAVADTEWAKNRWTYSADSLRMFQEDLPIVTLFTSFLTAPERKRWHAEVNERRKASRWLEKWPLLIRLLNRLIGFLDGRFHVQPKL